MSLRDVPEIVAGAVLVSLCFALIVAGTWMLEAYLAGGMQ